MSTYYKFSKVQNEKWSLDFFLHIYPNYYYQPINATDFYSLILLKIKVRHSNIFHC